MCVGRAGCLWHDALERHITIVQERCQLQQIDGVSNSSDTSLHISRGWQQLAFAVTYRYADMHANVNTPGARYHLGGNPTLDVSNLLIAHVINTDGTEQQQQGGGRPQTCTWLRLRVLA